jgi:hypothetical protein
MPEAQTAVPDQPDKAARAAEAFRRGLMGTDTKARYEEAIRRGIVKAPESAAAPMQPTSGEAGPLGAAESATRGLATTATHAWDSLIGNNKALGVDYRSGLGTNIESQLKMADNPAESRAVLDKHFGHENVFQDQGGRYFVKTPEGKYVAAAGGIVPSVIGMGPELVGGTVGAIAGGPVGAAVGGAAGKASQEWGKLLAGTQRKTLGQEAAGIGIEGLLSGAGQKAGEMVSGIPGAIGRLFRSKIAGVTPESRQMAAGIERAGGVAPLRSVAPGLSSPIQKQDIATRLGFDPLAERNRVVAQNRLREIVESTKIGPLERQAAMKEILDPGAAVSSAEAGGEVTQAVRGQVQGMERDIAALSAKRDRILDTQFRNIEGRMRQPGPLGEDVAAAFAQARKTFAENMELEYGPARQLVGDTPVVPTGPIKKAATDLLESMPKTAATKDPAGTTIPGQPIFEDPRVLDSVRKLTQLGPKIRLQDAQQIRSQLGDWGFSPDLVSSLPRHQFNDLKQSVESAFEAARADPAAARAVDMLRRADAKYAEGIKKFNNLSINQITKDLRDGIVPNPVYVADKVLREGQAQQAQIIKRMIGPQLWDRVAGADWQGILQAARDPQTGEIASRKLAAEIKARDESGLLDLTYGSRARDMRLYAQRLNARDEKIPANQLTPGNFGNVMRIMERRQGELDSYLKENYLSALAKPGRDQDEAIKWIVRPGDETRLVQAEKNFGAASRVMKTVRTQWLKEMLHSAVAQSDTGVGTTISGPAIEKALSGYTRKQLEILAPGGLAEDMRSLAGQLRAMFPVAHDQLGGALIAGQIKNLPLIGVPGGRVVGALRGGAKGGRIWNNAVYDAYSWIYSRPATVRVLTAGLKPGPGQAATRETVRGIFRAAAQGLLPQIGDGDFQDPATGVPYVPFKSKVGDTGPNGGRVIARTPRAPAQ